MFFTFLLFKKSQTVLSSLNNNVKKYDDAK